MIETKESDRRKFLKASGGALLAVGTVGVIGAAGQHHKSANLEVSNAAPGAESALVPFGGWMTDRVIDRFPNNPNTQFPRLQNHHGLPSTLARIRSGGLVTFLIGGFHIVTIYDGTQVGPGQIDTANVVLPANAPAPPIINDPNGRIYRGLDPTALPPNGGQDRIEVVHFNRPGVYLVICAVLPHFQQGMYGYVIVTP